MKNRIAFIILAAVTIGTTGCSMCCGPYDYDYPAFGGLNPRVDQRNGRLGSVFSDPNAMVVGDSADSNLTPPPEPKSSTIDEMGDEDDPEEELRKIEKDLERQRQKNKLNREDDPLDPESLESLPEPDTNTDNNGTASRLWRNRPLRSKQTWR